jgi:hypothetical protein
MADQELDLVTLGAAQLNKQTNVATIQTLREFGQDGETEPLGNAPNLCALGVTALPLGPSKAGHAEGIVLSPCGSYTSGIVGATDTRCADVIGELAPGEVALHSMGEDPTKRARVFCKENSLSLIIGNDTVFVMDRENEAVNLTVFGHTVEVSKENGIMMAEKGGAWIQLKDGKATISGSSTTASGALTMGDASAMPLAKYPPLATYLGAMQAMFAAWAVAIDAAPPNIAATPATIALSTFSAVAASQLPLMPTMFAKGT